MSNPLPPGVTQETADDMAEIIPKLAKALNNNDAVKSAFAAAKAGKISLEEFIKTAEESIADNEE